MFTFLLADMNLLYTLAIIIVLLFLFLELLGLIVGISLLDLLDNISPIDANSSLPITDGGVSNLLDWLCLKKLPMLVWLIIALTHFAIIGYSINYAVLTSLEWQLQLIFILPTTVFFTLIMTYFVGSALAKIIPNNETTAVSTSTFIGKAAKITIGTASSGNPAEALLIDDFNQKHYIMVEPEFEKEYLPQGTEVVIVDKLNGTWLAIPFK
ncbi:MAG: DUF1449 family protein [Moritella sp.]|uniref:OB-fold-containig protein n=1 Tax=unclassified Moritella TaxID=2637987 RepID=UPI0001569D9A|nr:MULTISPECIES: OB-fold-containig protein [unclassified Moritella]EDM65968.1 hypothetical protein PE36_12072 [Moritella sp. PE36]MBL1415847.1 DUF1449 family protein [Moritella sp.]